MDVPPCNGTRKQHEMRVTLLGVDYCSECGWVSPQGAVPDDDSPFRRKASRQPSTGSGQRRRKIPRLIARDGDVCHYCGLALVDENRTVDEKHPRSLGGRCVIDNQVLACRLCNGDKGQTPYDEYVAFVAGHGTARERRTARRAKNRLAQG